MARSQLRERLREATADAHERLHHHDGFAAVAAGAISLPLYRRLLARLLGFHSAFEAALARRVDIGRELRLAEHVRSPLLEADLRTLGMEPETIARLPRFAWRGRVDGDAWLMGALYVVEGSTLGGVHIARALKPLFGSDNSDGRRFFLGYGDSNGAMWRAFLSRVDDGSWSAADEDEMIAGAVATFADFEDWMGAWNARPARALAAT